MKTAALISIVISSAIAHGLAFPQASKAFTLEELTQTVERITQVSGAYQRYLQDLEKIKNGSSNPNIQPTRRQIEPEVWAQPLDRNDNMIQEIEEVQSDY